ncbi:MAG: hypothetical protein ANABAC_2095 [Anaerolineae bacterium]|jgi:hypothetical protein|nr:MAG: hypothetical protein ANABAC_2095 [Anaerolineae bacterium]
MKTRAVLTFLFVFSLVGALLLGVSFGKAQEPQPQEVQAPTDDVSVEASVDNKISFQGVLKEGGNPVNGSRDMIFRLYSDAACTTQLGSDITKENVPISNGVFSVDLDVSLAHFNGQAIWIQVEIDGTKMACQEILPAPYALSLIPGARITDANSEVYINRSILVGFMPPRWEKYGLYGKAEGSATNTTYYGIYGKGTDFGVYGESESGIAIRAAGTGIIKSDAPTDWVISPLKLIKEFGNFDINPSAAGFVILTPNSSGGVQADLPIDIAASLFGSRIYFRGYYFYYKTDTTGDVILRVSVRQTNADGSFSEICKNDTDLASTSWSQASCLEDGVAITGPLFIRFELFFSGSGGTHEIMLGKMWIQVSE